MITLSIIAIKQDVKVDETEAPAESTLVTHPWRAVGLGYEILSRRPRTTWLKKPSS